MPVLIEGKNENQRGQIGILKALGVLLVILVAAGIIRYNVINAEKAKSLEPVYLTEVERPEGIIAWGEVRYEKIYDINIDFPSSVTQVKVKEGDRVSMGQELVTLDISEYLGLMAKLREQLKAGEAGMKNTELDTSALLADIAQLQKDIKTKTNELNNGTNPDVEILQTSLVLTKKELENTQTDVNDNQELFKVGSISKSTFDQYYKGRSVAGPGLSICREIVEACSGTIWAENNEKGGTTIKIHLPS